MNDVTIIGAGPAGVTCALHLAAKGLKSTIIDKASFPRDKICGDALSGNVIYELEKFGVDACSAFNLFSQKQPTSGIKFIAPSGEGLLLKMNVIREGFEHAGYVSERIHFDNYLVELARENANIELIEGARIQDLKENKEGIELSLDGGANINTKFVVGADGAQSVVNKLLPGKAKKQHQSAGLRQYWEGVDGFGDGNPIELHFIKKTLPGYFWIFKLANNKANVGIGLRSDVISKRKINLKTVMKEIIEQNPVIAPRFNNATPLENPKGFGLPLGSIKKPLSGNNFIVIGDAASLIDPFTGEGIGNAMISGRVAANHLEKALAAKRYDAKFNSFYDKAIYKKLGSDLATSYKLQRMLKFPWLFNKIVKKANKNPRLHRYIESMLEDANQRQEITGLGFYLQLIFNLR